MSELNHECGIAAIYHLEGASPSQLAPPGGADQVSRLMPRMLLDLQNRGQLAAGFTTYDPNRQQILSTYRRLGTVIEAFRLNHQAKYESIMRDYAGRAVIGHVRYATCGANDVNYAQPFERPHGCKWKWFSIAFNGQLANFADLRTQLLDLTDYHVTRETDTEIIMHYLAHALRRDERVDLVEVFRDLCRQFDGAYNIVFLNAMGDMVIVRDPKGFRPLCYAQEGSLFAAASESVPLLNLGFGNIRSLQPGEIIVIQDGRVRRDRIAPVQNRAHCFFEWIYFANVASTLDDRSVYLTRAALGKELAREERRLGRVPLDADTIVVPVPDTGKAAADAMAHELDSLCRRAMRNRYVGRTFIEGENRPTGRLIHPLGSAGGKRILLVEDTIVRSTTMKSLLRNTARRGGIHVRVASPIVRPCFAASTVDHSRAVRASSCTGDRDSSRA